MAEVIIESTEKKYSFRELNATDVAPMCSIIGKIGINNFTKCFESSDELMKIFTDKSKSRETMTDLAGIKIALDMANIIITHIPDCENDVFNLLSNVSGLPVNEIKTFKLATFTEMVLDFIKKEEFKDFIGVVSKLFN